MNHLSRLTTLALLSLSISSVHADPIQTDNGDPYGGQISNNTGQTSQYTQSTSQNTENIANYLLHFGAYLGFDLTQQPKNPVSPLLSVTSGQLLGGSKGGLLGAENASLSVRLPFFSLVFDTFLGAIPVNTTASQFVPENNTNYSDINAFANVTFPSYNSGSSGQSNNVAAFSGIDQQTYQQDPVSQAVLNILSTPDISYCMDNTGTRWTAGEVTNSGTPPQQQFPECKFLYGSKVTSNVIGDLPTPYTFFTYDYNQKFISQLNTNTLLAPLLYSTTSNTSSSTSSSTSANQQSSGLPNQNQAQLAADFIRYATSSVVPISLPQQGVYNTLYAQALNVGNHVALPTQAASQSILTNYLAQLRAYAAMLSVPYSNLYYIFSKRMPQNPGGSSTNSASATSQALNEFTMATWRLYTPQGQANSQWLNQLNTASSATVQKEIATLLAEINYQLYLSRQQEERVLLTNTMLLLMGSHLAQPRAPTADSLNTSGTSTANQ